MDGEFGITIRHRDREKSTWLCRGHLLLAFLTIVDKILTKRVYNNINVFSISFWELLIAFLTIVDKIFIQKKVSNNIYVFYKALKNPDMIFL